MGHVAIPYTCKEFMTHKGSSFDCTPILKTGLFAGGRTSKYGRQTVFFAHLNPILETEPLEILTNDDFAKPRMEHCRSKWRRSQDAVNFVNLARVQDEGLQICQTRWNAIVLSSSVPLECIYKVISRNGELETRDASTSTKGCTQQFLANAATAIAAAAARRFWECISSQLQTVCGNFGEGRYEK